MGWAMPTLFFQEFTLAKAKSSLKHRKSGRISPLSFSFKRKYNSLTSPDWAILRNTISRHN